MVRRQASNSSLYTVALKDPRFSSGFGMYPSTLQPKKAGAGRAVSWILFKFGFVGALGLFLNVYAMYRLSQISAVTAIMSRYLGASFPFYIVFAGVSSEAAVLVNFLLNEALVFRGRKGARGFFQRMALFNAVSSADLVLRLPILWGLTTFLAVPALLSNFESILLTFTGRFLISEKTIWAKHAQSSMKTDAR